MAKSLILNIFGTPVPLPDPFSAVVLTPERPGIIVDGTPSEVIAQLGGLENIRGVLTVSEAPEVNPIDAVAFGLADVQSSTAPRTVFVFSPTAPGGARQNVYTDWATLVVALADVEGHKIIEFAEAEITIPAGAYDMMNVSWRKSADVDGDLELTLADGATFTDLMEIDGFLSSSAGQFIVATVQTAAPAVSLTIAGTVVIRNAILFAAGSEAFFGDSITDLVLERGGELDVFTSEVVENATGLTIELHDGAAIVEDTLKGAGSTAVDVRGAGGSLSLSHANLTEAITVRRHGDQFAYAFRPATISSGPTTLVPNEIARVDPTSGGFTVNLPDASRHPNAWITVVEVGGSANAVTVGLEEGGDSINGAASIASARGSRTYVSDGVTIWYEIASNI